MGTDASRLELCILLIGLLASGAEALPPPPAGVQTSTSYGIQFSTIASPGNRPANITEAPGLYPPFSIPASPVGAVANAFGLSRTEITASQWLGFVQAYAPYHNNTDLYDTRFTSDWVQVTPNGPGQIPTYSVPTVGLHRPVTVGWDYAARFCNWLTNGQRSDQAAFETGAYDLRNLPVVNGHWTALPARLPTATYWLPSLNEWDKAAYYDPNRYGTGQEGYWKYPDGSNTSLVPGWPEDGGQTDAGIPYSGPSPNTRFNDVAAYGAVQSPWGLFDLSGGVTEWNDTPDGFLDGVGSKGTPRYEQADLVPAWDQIDWAYGGYGLVGYSGIRLASSIPAPSGLLLLGLLGLFSRRIRDKRTSGRRDHSRGE